MARDEFELAESDFTEVLRLKEKHIPALINRAKCRRDIGKLTAAKEDLDRAIELHAPQTRVFFMRAEINQELGNSEAAEDDFAEGVQRQPTDHKSFFRRGVAIMKISPERAIEDFQKAIELNPRSYGAHRNWAYVLGERLQRYEDAIKILDQMLEWSHTPSNELISRAVMFGRLGQRNDAIRDVKAAIRLRQDGKSLFQAACVYSLASAIPANQKSEQDAAVAVKFVQRAIGEDPHWKRVARYDPDLNALRGRKEFDAVIAP